MVDRSGAAPTLEAQLDLLEALGRGEVDVASLVGIDASTLRAVTDRAVGRMEHGKLEEAETLLASLSALAGVSETITTRLAEVSASAAG